MVYFRYLHKMDKCTTTLHHMYVAMLLHNFSEKYRTYVSRHVPHGYVVLYILCILNYFLYHACSHDGFGFETKFMETKFLGFQFCISRWSKYILPWDIIFKLWYIWVRKEMLIRLLKYIPHRYSPFFWNNKRDLFTELINSRHELVVMISKKFWKSLFFLKFWLINF